MENSSDFKDQDEEVPDYAQAEYAEPFTDDWILQKAPEQLARWRQYPFSRRLDEWLKERWKPDSKFRPNPMSANFECESMVREEDLPIVQRHLTQYGAQEKAFRLYWDSGWFDRAEELVGYLPESIQERSFAELRLCRQFSELGIWGRCPVVVSLFKQASQVCSGIRTYPNKLPNLLIVGETGTGKETLAFALHTLAGRGGFRAINCAEFASNPELMRSELFGHVKGSFTGAIEDKSGLLEVCKNKGTVLFDEIDSLPPGLGGDLLRALQERKFRQVGGIQDYPVDTLFIAATNQDLEEQVRNRRFREDLLSRLKGSVFQLPPLRKRFEDIPLLVNQILLAYGDTEVDDGRDELAKALIAMLRHASGNVRWLEQEVGRWVRLTAPSGSPPTPPTHSDGRRERFIAALNRVKSSGAKVTQAAVARELGVSRPLLQQVPWKDFVKEYNTEFVKRKRS